MRVVFTNHARERAEERGVDLDEAALGVQRFASPVLMGTQGRVTGRWGSAVVAFREERAVIITVY